MPERKPIFYDQERRRWRRTRLVLEITGALFTLVLVVFLLNVVRNPELPDLLRPDTRAGLHAIPFAQQVEPLRRGRKRKIAALGKSPAELRSAARRLLRQRRLYEPGFASICTITISTC